MTANTTIERAGNSKAMRAVRNETVFRARIDTPAAEPAGFYDRPRFTSVSGRTAGFLDQAGMQDLAEQHEWMRDRIARLELENALLRSVIETGARPAACAEPATV